MKNIAVNMVLETMSDDAFERCGIKKCKHKEHAPYIRRVVYWDWHFPFRHIILRKWDGLDGCVAVQIVDVNDPYYKQARKFPNGHLTYLSPYLVSTKEGWIDFQIK